MTGYSRIETPLNEPKKNAYRYLLYQAMLDIRNLCQSRGSEGLNPVQWRSQYRDSRIAGKLADWLHNPACYASMDFKGFDADYFWQEYDGKCRRFALNNTGRYQPIDYCKHYQQGLEDQGVP